MRSFAWVFLVALITACVPSASGTPAALPCPLTTPPPVALTPPPSAATGPNAGMAFRAGPGSFLYGNESLVVLLPNDSTLRPSDPARGLPGGMKFPWWRIAPADVGGQLSITTRRLDGPATPLPADVPGGYGDEGFQATGLNFPIAGCWEVRGGVAGKTLTFVVNVAER